jgi:hypothetical protein
VSAGFDVSNGSEVVMQLPFVSYGALYQAALLDRVLDLVKENDLAMAWKVVEEAILLADSLECPWCDRLGLHELCWEPRTLDLA